MNKSLVLFDIDGTLLQMHGAGRRAFRRALQYVFGWDDDIAYINFYGATDLDVLDRICRRHNEDLTHEKTAAFFARMPIELRETVLETGAETYPGVHELLKHLSGREDVLLGIVTGNIESCARIKLETAGLHDHFMLGAFGHEHADRNDIARLAVRRAKAHLPEGEAFCRIILIGDSAADVQAAKAIGAMAMAVATGRQTAEELRAARADEAFEDLSDLRCVLRAMKL